MDFGKFPHADLRALYGIEIIELNVWRPLVGHLEEQLAWPARRSSKSMPSTSPNGRHVVPRGTRQDDDRDPAHRQRRAPARLLAQRGRLRALGRGLQRHVQSRRAAPGAPATVCRGREAQGTAARARAARSSTSPSGLLCHHVARRPATNPFRRYAERSAERPGLAGGGNAARFSRLRLRHVSTVGAAFELAATYLRWLERHGELELDAVAVDCDAIATTAKALQFKVARMVQTRRRFDAEPMVETMAAAWDNAMGALGARYGELP